MQYPDVREDLVCALHDVDPHRPLDAETCLSCGLGEAHDCHTPLSFPAALRNVRVSGFCEGSLSILLMSSEINFFRGLHKNFIFTTKDFFGDWGRIKKMKVMLIGPHTKD